MELVERDDLIARLRGFQRSAAAGIGCLVWLGGEAGVGKSAVLQALADDSPHRVMWGRLRCPVHTAGLGPLHDIAAEGAPRVATAMVAGASRHALFGELLAELA